MNHHRLLLLVLAWISQLVLIQARWRENIIEKRGSDVIEGEGTVQEFSQDSSVDQVVADRQLQAAAKNVGNNGVPASAFPLRCVNSFNVRHLVGIWWLGRSSLVPSSRLCCPPLLTQHVRGRL
jgi:hypothetical protein